MKYIIFLCLTAICSVAHAQTPTVIPASTTIEAFSALTAGQYRFFGTGTIKDTTDVSIDKSLVCAPSVPCPPVVCPVCPVCPGPAVGISINKVGQVIVTYQNGSTTIFTLKNSILIQ